MSVAAPPNRPLASRPLASRPLASRPLALARACWGGLRAGLADAGLAAPPAAQSLAEATRNIQAGAFAAADAGLERYLRHVGNANEDALELYAVSAHNAGRYDEALFRWRRLRDRNPNRSDAWIGMAANARETDRLGLARSIVAEAESRFPDDVVLMTEALRVSEAQGCLDESLRWCEAIVAALPQDPAWWLRYVDRLMGAHRFGAAMVVARRALDRHPDHRLLAARLLGACRLNSDFGTALEELARLRQQAGGTTSLCDALMDLFGTDADMVQWVFWHAINERADELADAIAATVPLRFPEDARFRFETARLAFVKEDWRRVVDLLDTGAGPAGDEARNREMLGFARMNLEGPASEPEGGSVRHDEPDRVGGELDDAALLREFESLGVDCEFGLLQRQHGVEPLGLTRWMGVTAEILAAMVDAAFAGLGSVETSRLTMRTSGEYFFTDTRYAFEYHTWMYQHEVEAEALLTRTRRHVSFLTRLLLDELRAPTRILVLKTFAEDVGQVRRLHEALLRHGPCTLLWVRSAANDPALAADIGRVREIDAGLYAAALSSFGNRIGDWDIAGDQWLAICRQARDLRHASSKTRVAVADSSADAAA